VQELVTPTPTPLARKTTSSKSNATNATGDNSTNTTDSGSEEAGAADVEDVEATPTPDVDATATPVPEPVYRSVKRTLRYPLTVVEDIDPTLHVLPLSVALKTSALATLKRLTRLDEERHAREGAKNALEAYVYATRERLSNEEEALTQVATNDQLDAIRESIASAEEWLYDEGAATDMETYKARLREVKEVVEPVFFRLVELEERPKLLNDTQAFITASYKLMGAWKTSHPQINVNETADAVAAVEKFDKWFAAQLTAQETLSNLETPTLTRDMVTTRVKPITDLLTRLSRKPKPTPKPTPKAKVNATTAEQFAEQFAKKAKAKAQAKKAAAEAAGDAAAGDIDENAFDWDFDGADFNFEGAGFGREPEVPEGASSGEGGAGSGSQEDTNAGSSGEEVEEESYGERDEL
jgi:hypothetical protein